MQKPLLRIPFTGLLPPATIIPRNANSTYGALSALCKFLTASPSPNLVHHAGSDPNSTVILSGAGLSVASGLADYRGSKGTYRVNKTFRPIYYHEFLQSHEARKRYWARSFLGWTSLHKAKPNPGHWAIRDLGSMGLVRDVITQNVDSFHPAAHPELSTIELHGYLRSVVCTACHSEFPRDEFQEALARLNPAWATFLAEAVASGALDTEDPEKRRQRGVKTNPDGDVDLPGAPYTTFRYPPCPKCHANPPTVAGKQSVVDMDKDGAWQKGNTAGILKPAVVMFGENIAPEVKNLAQRAINESGRLLIIGSSLATYSAWRLAKQAKDRGMPIGILNLGGVRGEEIFFQDLPPSQQGELGVRVEMPSHKFLPAVVQELIRLGHKLPVTEEAEAKARGNNSGVFRDMLS